MLATTRAYTDL